MKYEFLRVAASLCCGVVMVLNGVASPQEVWGADPAASGATKVKSISLFDGKTLKGWKQLDNDDMSGAEVSDGALRLKVGDPITTLVWTGEELPKVNYELTMEARRVDGADFFATVTFPVKESTCSLVLGGWGGGLVGLSSLDGADASENETTEYVEFKKNQWYKIRVRVTGTHIQAWIDDRKMVDIDYSDREVSVRIEMARARPLALSSYQTIGEVRNIRVTPIAPEGK
jgi:hypothetical protein